MEDIKSRLIADMETYFGDDQKRIRHAKAVTGYVEQLMEPGNNYDVCIAAGVLHDIGIHEAERKHGSNAGKYQEMEGPDVARPILQRLGFPEDKTAEICQIIAHHHSPGNVKTPDFQVLYEADWLVNLKDEYGLQDAGKLEKVINKVFQTSKGQALARKIYLNQA